MERNEQYKHLLDIVSSARVLVTNSDDDTVIHNTQNIKIYGKMSAIALGFSEAKFDSDSVVLYREKINQGI